MIKYDIDEYFVSVEKMPVVDIPASDTHNIENLGTAGLVLFIRCCECLDR